MASSKKLSGPMFPHPIGDVDDTNSIFAKLRTARLNSDWMPPLSNSQEAQARIVSPAGTSSSLARSSSPSTAPSNSLTRSCKSFFSKLYHAPNSQISTPQIHPQRISQPSKALGDFFNNNSSSSSLQPALPIDATVAIKPSKMTLSTFLFPIGKTPGLEIGSDMCGAFVPISISKAAKCNRRHPVPPLPIDCNLSAPSPLLSNPPVGMISFMDHESNLAPTQPPLNTSVLHTTVTSSSEALHPFTDKCSCEDRLPVPIPPRPICATLTEDVGTEERLLLRTTDANSANQNRPKGPPQPFFSPSPTSVPLVQERERQNARGLPLAEEHSTDSLFFLSHKYNDTGDALSDTPSGVPALHNPSTLDTFEDTNEKVSTMTTSPKVLEFSLSVEKPFITRTAAQKQANVRNFLNTLFSSPPVVGPDSDATPDNSQSKTSSSFNCLELAIRGAVETPLNFMNLSPSQGQNNTMTSGLNFQSDEGFGKFEDNSEEGLERLRHVVSIVLQTAKQQKPSSENFTETNGADIHSNRPTGTASSHIYSTKFAF